MPDFQCFHTSQQNVIRFLKALTHRKLTIPSCFFFPPAPTDQNSFCFTFYCFFYLLKMFFLLSPACFKILFYGKKLLLVFPPISQFFGKKICFQHKLKRRKPALRSRPSLLCPLPWLKVQDGNALSVNAWRSSKLFQTPATCFRCDGGEKHSKTIKLKKFELIFKLTKRRRKNLKSNWPILSLKKSLFKVFFCTFLIIKPRSRILILWVDRFRFELSSRFPINHRSRLYWTKRNLLAQKGEEIFFIHKHEKDFKWKKGKKVRQELSA